MAFWMAKMRNMKKKDEKSCMNVPVLFRHDSRRFFFRSAAYCCQSSGKPRRKFMLSRVLAFKNSFFLEGKLKLERYGLEFIPGIQEEESVGKGAVLCSLWKVGGGGIGAGF